MCSLCVRKFWAAHRCLKELVRYRLILVMQSYKITTFHVYNFAISPRSSKMSLLLILPLSLDAPFKSNSNNVKTFLWKRASRPYRMGGAENFATTNVHSSSSPTCAKSTPLSHCTTLTLYHSILIRAWLQDALGNDFNESYIIVIIPLFKLDPVIFWTTPILVKLKRGGNALLGPEDIENPKRALENGA